MTTTSITGNTTAATAEPVFVSAPSSAPGGRCRSGPTLVAFEDVYRANFGAVNRYFSRRCSDPQTAMDLTSETFTRAIGSLGSYDARHGSPRSWLLGVARHVYADHCHAASNGSATLAHLAGQRVLGADEIEEALSRIDAEREHRALLVRWARLPEIDRDVIELVDIDGLSRAEAAAVLGISAGTLRVRLYRARKRLRMEAR